MPIAPEKNRVFVPKVPFQDTTNTNNGAAYTRFVSTIDKRILEQQSEAMDNLLKKNNTLIGGDKLKEQFTMRGHLDSIESVLNDMVTELRYHS